MLCVNLLLLVARTRLVVTTKDSSEVYFFFISTRRTTSLNNNNNLYKVVYVCVCATFVRCSENSLYRMCVCVLGLAVLCTCTCTVQIHAQKKKYAPYIYHPHVRQFTKEHNVYTRRALLRFTRTRTRYACTTRALRRVGGCRTRVRARR